MIRIIDFCDSFKLSSVFYIEVLVGISSHTHCSQVRPHMHNLLPVWGKITWHWSCFWPLHRRRKVQICEVLYSYHSNAIQSFITREEKFHVIVAFVLFCLFLSDQNIIAFFYNYLFDIKVYDSAYSQSFFWRCQFKFSRVLSDGERAFSSRPASVYLWQSIWLSNCTLFNKCCCDQFWISLSACNSHIHFQLMSRWFHVNIYYEYGHVMNVSIIKIWLLQVIYASLLNII
jgi:hypothetical protein